MKWPDNVPDLEPSEMRRRPISREFLKKLPVIRFVWYFVVNEKMKIELAGPSLGKLREFDVFG